MHFPSPKPQMFRLVLLFIAVSITTSTAGTTAAAEDTDKALAQKTQNPVADLISVPFQNNTSYNSGPRERTQNVMNIQPVIPVNLNDEYNLITRTILPIVSEPSSFSGQDRQNGIGDTTFTAFISPKEPAFGGLIWGAGPVFNIPTASDDRLGADLWGMGISAVGLTIQGPIVAGAIVSNTWSLEGEDFSRFLLQYFVNYNFAHGWYLSSSPIMTADWEVDHNAWTIPVGGGFGKIHRIRKIPVNLSFQAFYNAEKTKFGGDWSTRLQIQLLLPALNNGDAKPQPMLFRSLLLCISLLLGVANGVHAEAGSMRAFRKSDSMRWHILSTSSSKCQPTPRLHAESFRNDWHGSIRKSPMVEASSLETIFRSRTSPAWRP